MSAQVVSLLAILFANFVTLLYAMRYFAFNDTLLHAWLEAFGISLAIGFGFIDIVVILVRNNVGWMRKILQTRRYQVIEKFVVAPIGGVFNFFRNMLFDMLC